MDISEIKMRELLVNVVESNGYENIESLAARHIERMYAIKKNVSAYSFMIERHPHLFGRSSLGCSSSAFIEVLYEYRYEPMQNNLEIVSISYGDVHVNYKMLATNEVDMLFDSDTIQFDDSLLLCKTIDEVDALSGKRMTAFNWELVTDYEDKLPKDFNKKYMACIEDSFRCKMRQTWKSLKD